MGNAVGVCAPWADVADIDCATVDDAVLARWLLVASEVLYNLTGRAWPGECQETIRPVAADCWRRGCFGIPVTGVWSLSGWDNQRWQPTTANQSRSHSGRWLSEVHLPSRPVIEIVEVMLDGFVVDPTRYRMANRRSLVMTPQPGDEWQAWPCWQDDRVDTTEPGTFGITYKYGEGPPPAGAEMAAFYACQLSLGASGAACQLPSRVTNITRQGVSMTILDPFEFVEKGMVGLAMVDTWIASVWAGRKRRRATLTALDRRKPTRRDLPLPPGS